MVLLETYQNLLAKYSYQGWWPVYNGKEFKYSTQDYSHPKNETEQFEICIGALLTQNTNWDNVMKALEKLIDQDCLSPEKILKLDDEKLQQLIRSSGYFRQKSERLKMFSAKWNEVLAYSKKSKNEFREFLLSLKGIGKETADSMMLYAFKFPIFVIDSYTKRFCVANKIFDSSKLDYDVYQEFFEKNLKRNYRLYNEFHALIVAWAKDNK